MRRVNIGDDDDDFLRLREAHQLATPELLARRSSSDLPTELLPMNLELYNTSSDVSA